MSTLIGFIVGTFSMTIIMGICAAFGVLAFSHVDSLAGLYAGVAAGILVVLAIVSYLA